MKYAKTEELPPFSFLRICDTLRLKQRDIIHTGGASMNLKQLLGQTLQEWREISGLDFCLLQSNGEEYLPASSHPSPSKDKIETFLSQDAVAKASASVHYYKIFKQQDLIYILIVWGKGTQAHTIGELAVCQVQSILKASKENLDKNVYIQNLLLGNYSPIEIHNRARRLRISETTPRAIFVIAAKQARDSHVQAVIQGIFSARTGNFVTSIDEDNLILVKELTAADTYEKLEKTARTLVDMLGTEAMITASVSYGNVAHDLSELKNAYQEALTALEVGRIFYPAQNTFGYKQLGIGHLIYQLPQNICDMFLEETFKGENLQSIDEETLKIVNTFFENNLNLSETARQLYLHRNTLVYRIEKLEKRFGLDIRTFEDAMTFKLAMMVSDYRKYRRKQ